MGARRTVRCASTEPAKPCNPATTHTLSRTLDRNTTKRTPQRHAARPAVHEEASSGAESAPLGVKDNTIKPRACEDGSSSCKCPMVAVGLASRSNWVKRTPSALRKRAQAIPSLHGSPTTHRNYKGHRGTSRDTAAAAAAVVVAVVVVVAAASATTQPCSKKDTHKPNCRKELASRSNG